MPSLELKKYSSVSTNEDHENSSSNNKYKINNSKENFIKIQKKILITLILIGLFLCFLTGLFVYLFTNKCNTNTKNEITRKTEKLIRKKYERLPQFLTPERYDLELIPDFEEKKFNGNLTIQLKSIEDTDKIFLNVLNVSIDKESTKLKENDKEIPIDSQIILQEDEKLIISLVENLKKNKNYFLFLKFSFQFNKNLVGVYESETVMDENIIGSIISTQFSPIEARRAFPCFDEPIFKANFSLKIARPSNLTTISNMPQLSGNSTTPFKERSGWFWDNFKITPPLPTYTIAFFLTNFPSKNFQYIGNSTNITNRFFARHESIEQLNYVEKIFPNMLKYLEEILGNLFIEKLDVIALEDFGFSAMENYGILSFRESSILYEESNKNAQDQKDITRILAHELCHQWFGNIITHGWWDDLWLKEGFSTYLSYRTVDYVFPNWMFAQEILQQEMMPSFTYDSFKFAKAIGNQVDSLMEIRDKFSQITYSKGACLIRMIRHFLTPIIFDKSLKIFLEENKYKSINRKILFKHFDKIAISNNISYVNQTTTEEIMRNYLEKPGFPYLNLKTNFENKTITIIQKRYILNNDDNDYNDETIWWIPISIITDLVPNINLNDTTPKFWMNNKSINININFNEWYLININQTGYYMVNYDVEMWYKLIENLMNFPPFTRSQLISDSMELAKNNLLSYDVPLKLITKMAINDKDIFFLPHLITFEKLDYLRDLLIDTPAFGLFEKFHQTIFKDTYRVVDFSDPYDDYLSLRIMNTVLEWSCKSTESRCANNAHILYRRWMQKKNVLKPKIRPIVYCTGIREGGKSEWEYAYHQYKITKSQNEKKILLDALGCTEHEWLLSRYLNILLDPTVYYSVKIQNFDRIFESLSKNRIGSRFAFDYLRRNWNELKKSLGTNFNLLNNLITTLPKHMNNEFQLMELENFQKFIGDIDAERFGLNAVIEIVRSKVNWMKNNYKNVEIWLQTNQNHFDF